MSRKKDKGSTVPHPTSGKKGNKGNGSRPGGGKSVPQAKAGTPGVALSAAHTVELPVVESDNGGNGHSVTPGPGVRPVKVRVGNVYATAGRNGNGQHASNGNGTGNGLANGNGHGYGYGGTVRINADTVAVGGTPQSTSRLREVDLTSLRLKLKTEEWDAVHVPKRRKSSHKRPLPYFLMRHRSLRGNTRVGYVRSQASVRKYGSGGVMSIVARLMLVLILLSFVVTASGIGAAFAVANDYISKLPTVDPSQEGYENHGLNIQTTKIYDRNGIPLLDLVDETYGMRQRLALKDISPLVISATLAAEDASFYNNLGVDPVGIVRAIGINLSGEGQSGASTITQQLVRQTVLDKSERVERSFERKIKEAVLAVQMTRTFSKDDILEEFLNQNYYGHRAYGIGAASLTYFGKSTKELSLAEAALLAGLPQAPSEYDPIIHPREARIRQVIVLDLMAKQGMITEEEATAAKIAQPVLRPYKPPTNLAPHFVYYVKEYLEKKYGAGVSEAGLRVYTTLDINVQKAAEQVAKDRIDELRKQKATNASIVIMKPGTGEILAMVGSVDYNDTSIDGQVNVATRERQPGSSFKPITYATAFKKGWTPGTVVLDTWTAFPNPGQKAYTPKNYDGRDHGYVTVRESLANSFNIPAVKAIQYAGVQETIDTAHDMGIKGLNRGLAWYGMSLTLGGGEVTLLDMTTAYSTFANGGIAVDANPILRIEQPGVGTLEQLDPEAKSKGKHALDPRIAYMITSILSDNRARTPAFGPNSPLRTSFPSAAKTGTTDDNRDSWTMGYTPNLAVGVWVGNSNNDEMLKVTGAIGAAVVWHNVMEAFYDNEEFVDLVRGADGKVKGEFVQPGQMITASACSAKGVIKDLFLKEAQPKGCTTYKDPKVNKQLSAPPSNNTTRPATRVPAKPQVPPTPIPGIGPPEYQP